MSGQHARLSASGAERFMVCSGSVALTELLTEMGVLEDEEEWTAEGTAAHILGQRCLEDQQDTYMYSGQLLYVDSNNKEWAATPEMCVAVQEYVDYVRYSIGDAEMIIEQRIDDPSLGPDFGGTADVVGHRLKDGGGFIRVTDYKHGIGIAVDIEGNAQLYYYAFGVLRKLGVKVGDDIDVYLTIVQPRAFHSGGTIREVCISSDDILKWGEEELIPAMARVDSGDTELVAGEHCRFCPAKIACTKLRDNFTDLDKDSSMLPDMTNDAMALLYEKIKTVQMFIKALKAECKTRAMNSAPVAGTKLVYGRSTRKWKPEAEDKLYNEYEDAIYTEPVLLSPSQIESLPGGSTLTGRYSYKEKGRPNLVGAKDRGEPYDPSTEGNSFSKIKSG